MNSDEAIRDLPLDERPRDRLLSNGSASLSDTELLSILLRTGRPGVSSIHVAREVLHRFGSLGGLLGATAEGLRRPGLGPAKAATVLAALELGSRLAKATVPDREPMSATREMTRYLALRYSPTGPDLLGGLYPDTRNRLRDAHRRDNLDMWHAKQRPMSTSDDGASTTRS